LPHDEDIRHNLQLANLLITDRVEPAPRLFIWDWWDAVKGWFTLSGITIWGYAFYLLVLIGIGAVVLAPAYSLRRVALIASAAAFALLVFSLLVFVGKLNDVQRSDVGIVTASVTTVKNSPDANSTDAFVLHSGAKIWVTDRVNKWLKIRIADGKVGWMDEHAAEQI
ncbi:MAG TPA: SH3 domain-containing protein, partial [Bacteroidota bacterium]|nr:SH3 domain-containing protein [Bacteroidota bacterium]